MQRYGQVIRVNPDKVEAYEKIHAAVWPEVLETIASCNIYNYTIFRLGFLLFAYFEYRGEDFKADMAKMATDPKTQEWWSLTDPMQQPFEERAQGEWWATMQEIFHTD